MKTTICQLATGMICILLSTIIVLDSSAQFSGGTGIPSDPYQVATPGDLDNVRNYLTSYFIQTANIDLNIAPYNTGDGWVPIGTSTLKFSGNFNGQQYTITGLFINRPATNNIGLFGYTSNLATLENVGLPDVNVTGQSNVGALVGYNEGTVKTSYSSGILSGNQYVGGLAGYNNGNTPQVGQVSNSYSLAYVSASNANGYSGGLAGYNYYGTITNSYASGGVGGTVCGALVGRNTSGIYNNCFWNSETGAQLVGNGGTGIMITQMKSGSTFTNAGWDFNNIWTINNGVSYPKLQSNPQAPEPGPRPIIISSIQKLDEVRNFRHGHYVLQKNLDFNDDGSYEQIGDWQALKTALTTGEGLNPLSNNTVRFIGLFDGNGYCIKNLYINRPTTDYIALFGFVGGAGKIRNLGVDNANVSGRTYVGVVIGYNEGTVATTYSSGILNALNFSGGLSGYNNGNDVTRVGLIMNCYSLAYVAASATTGDSGGLVGFNYYATITNSYSSGGVAGSSCGGMVGRNTSGTCNNSFWNSETSAQLASYGGEGITIPQMKAASTFINAGWDMVNIWTISDGISYPKLQSAPQVPDPGPRAFLINSIQDLDNVRNFRHGHYILQRTLDFNDDGSYEQTGDWQALKTLMTSGAGWNPLSSNTSRFVGLFDGNGYSIRNLYINRPATDYIGLFGFTGGAGKIRNLGLENARVTGRTYVGMVAGYNEGTLATSYTTGILNANNYAGGLTGYNNGNDITRIGLIINCYSLAYISASGSPGDSGGLVGYNYYATITSSYSSGGVSGSACGAMVGKNINGTYNNSFWNSETSAYLTSEGGTGINMSQMKTLSTYANAGWDIANVWSINDQVTYPWLKGSQPLPLPGPNPFPIYTIQDLDNARNLLHGHYIIMNDLDFNDNSSYAQIEGWEDFKISVTTGSGFQPIGSSTSKFTGFFDGNGKSIKNLCISRTATNYIGLFGYVGGAGWVSNLGLKQISINGKDYTGGIAGVCQGRIVKSYSAGQIQGVNNVGGICGYADGNNLPGLVQNAYTLANVAGTSRIGGAVGWSYYGELTNIYSSGGVTGNASVGGLVGYTNSGVVNNSFWNVETSGQNTSVGGTGIVTEEMMQAITFINAGWDFTNTWSIIETESYPWLRSNIQVPYPAPVPVEIYTIQDLNNVRNVLHGHYILMNDLDFNDNNSYAQTPGWEALKASFTSGSGFPPIGTLANKFTGYFNGNGNKIINLYINLPASDYVGLFGYYRSASSIRNLGLQNVDITGRHYVGAIAGYNSGNILRCYAKGRVKGVNYTGGLAGMLNGNNYPGGRVQDCYSFVYVEGNDRVGGITGWNYYGSVINCYAVGGIMGASNVGGLIGYENYSTVLRSFWNIESTGQISSVGGGSGIYTWQMMLKSTFQKPGWDFSNTWAIIEDQTYPWLIPNPQVPYPGPAPIEIWTIQDLDNVRNLMHGHYKLMTDLDFNTDASYAQVEGWEAYKTSMTTGQGFLPIGNASGKFCGLFDGNGHKISNLYINRPAMDYVGLFGFYQSAGNVKDLGLLNVNITGNNYTGSLAGRFSSTIYRSYASGSIQGSAYAGGLVGMLDGNNTPGGYISNSYSLVNVAGTDRVGGLLGWNYYGTVDQCYSTGLVIGNSNKGGLVGYQNYGTAAGSYWNTQTSGQSASAGGIGRTTADMTYPYSPDTYSNWNFTHIWADDTDQSVNNGYPYLGFPSVYESPNIIIPANENACYEAEKVVALAGGGSVVQVKSGASLEVVAKQSVLLLDGMVINQGAYFHAFIVNESGYCSNSKSILAIDENADLLPAMAENPCINPVNIFPNPTTGRFTLRLNEISEQTPVQIEILSIIGERIFKYELPPNNAYLFDLADFNTGIYLIRISNGKQSVVRKLIKN